MAWVVGRLLRDDVGVASGVAGARCGVLRAGQRAPRWHGVGHRAQCRRVWEAAGLSRPPVGLETAPSAAAPAGRRSAPNRVNRVNRVIRAWCRGDPHRWPAVAVRARGGYRSDGTAMMPWRQRVSIDAPRPRPANRSNGSPMLLLAAIRAVRVIWARPPACLCPTRPPACARPPGRARPPACARPPARPPARLRPPACPPARLPARPAARPPPGRLLGGGGGVSCVTGRWRNRQALPGR
jgi:hypothetical protein